MKKGSLLAAIAFCLFCTHVRAQQYPKHTIGAGILLGAGSFHNTIDYTFGFGKVDYQRNFAH